MPIFGLQPNHCCLLAIALPTCKFIVCHFVFVIDIPNNYGSLVVKRLPKLLLPCDQTTT